MTQENDQPTKDGKKLAKVERNPNGTVKAGSVLNPNGKAPGTLSLTTKLREALMAVAKNQSRPYHAILIDRILQKALVDGDNEMIKLIFGHLEGAPAQKIAHSIDQDPITGFNYTPPAKQ